jgi:two-component sensor histidine kinase
MLPVLAFGIASAVAEFYDRSEAVQERLIARAYLVTKELQATVKSAHQVLDISRNQPSVKNGVEPACTRFLQSAIAGLPHIGNIATVSSTGDVECSALPEDEPVNVFSHQWFRSVNAKKSFVIGGPIRGELSGDVIIVAAQPISPTGNMDEGIISLSIRTDYIGETLDLGKEATQTKLFLIDRDGRSLLPGQDRTNLPPKGILADYLATKDTVLEAAGADEVDRLYASIRLDESDVYVVLARQALSANLPVITELVADVAALLILFAVTLLIVWLATERMSIRWVKHLRAVAIAQRRGMSGVRARGLEKAPIEYRELGEAFNSMADAIERRQENLVESLAERERLLREVHHRVKNNLQIVISLFNLNARNSEDERERAQLRDMQVRVESLALAHHAAYQSGDMQFIPMDEFLPTLLEHTKVMLEDDEQLVIAPAVTDSVRLPMDDAVPLAQIILEAIASIRLVSDEPTQVSISLINDRPGWAILRLTTRADASGPKSMAGGNGIEDDMGEYAEEDTRRLRLSRSLVGAFARQLGGHLQAAADLSDITLELPLEKEGRV